MRLFNARGENPLALPAGDEPAGALEDEEEGRNWDRPAGNESADEFIVYSTHWLSTPMRLGT